jgi:uncharacterized protein with von Willebrand factor type A (vWA) domain
VNPIVPSEARLALKSVCAGSVEDSVQFDKLFDSFWMADGRVRHKVIQTKATAKLKDTKSTRTDETQSTAGKGSIEAPEDAKDGEDSYAEGTGKLVASKTQNLMKKDLRELVSAEDIRAAEQVAIRLGKALRDRRSRRRNVARRGTLIDLRRTIRQSLSTGGDPLHLAKRKRPDRPMKIVALCDVSGSMMNYARPFLAFLAGLIRADSAGDAYLFHTRLVRITNALRDDDPLRALNRITLLADGFGGGSKIGARQTFFFHYLHFLLLLLLLRRCHCCPQEKKTVHSRNDVDPERILFDETNWLVGVRMVFSKTCSTISFGTLRQTKGRCYSVSPERVKSGHHRHYPIPEKPRLVVG